jgi:hypothetical protein
MRPGKHCRCVNIFELWRLFATLFKPLECDQLDGESIEDLISKYVGPERRALARTRSRIPKFGRGYNFYYPQIKTPLLVQLAAARLENSIRHEKTLPLIKRQGLKT